MKHFIYKARENRNYFVAAMMIAIVLMIVSGAFTTVSFVWGSRFIEFSLYITTYILFFMNVDPLLKGMVLALIPVLGTLAFFSLHDALVPDDFYPAWLNAETASPRHSGSGAVYMIAVFIVTKIAKVKPLQHTEE
ncbi:hypothetical protein [Halobacillus andaensis]|uniref:hypothetical protein n=1 Tax=Halobacillus andaensis TaxID=1176239 RepID=UPI003D75D1DC